MREPERTIIQCLVLLLVVILIALFRPYQTTSSNKVDTTFSNFTVTKCTIKKDSVGVLHLEAYQDDSNKDNIAPQKIIFKYKLENKKL
jgi:hypothetical protein